MEQQSYAVTGITSICIGYTGLIFAPFIGPLSPLYTYGLIYLGTGAIALNLGKAVYKIVSRDKLHDLIRALKLDKDGKMPEIIRKTKKEYGLMYEIKMLPGQCVSDYEKHKEAFDQYLKADCDFSFAYNLIIRVRQNQLKETYDYIAYECNKPLQILIGYSKYGAYFLDLAEAPHVIIAGTTGSGKSVLLRSIITSLILTKSPKDINIHLIDFARVELGIFKKSNRISSFSYNAEQFISLLSRLKEESTRRLKLFESKNITNIDSWNKKYPNEHLTKEIIIVDELAAVKSDKLLMNMLMERVAQDRKCGIHYILTTQRPSVDVINGTIKANIPVRIALKVTSDTDSQVILDYNGAELLRGKGNALIKADELTEIQTMFLTEEQAMKLIRHTYKRDEATAVNCDTSGVVRHVNRKRSAAHAAIR